MATIARRAIALFALVALLSLPTTSVASRVISYEIPVDTLMFYAECPSPPEEIAFEGTLHVVLREDPTTPGGVHQLYHTNARISGTGMATGNRYRWVDSFNLHTNASQSDSGAYEYEITQVHRIISQGSGDNFHLQVVTKLTIPPDGEPSTEFQFIEEVCRG